MKRTPTSRSHRSNPMQSSTGAKGAAFASETERFTLADDGESSGRLEEPALPEAFDILDDQDTFERPDSAAIQREESDEEERA